MLLLSLSSGLFLVRLLDTGGVGVDGCADVTFLVRCSSLVLVVLKTVWLS